MQHFDRRQFIAALALSSVAGCRQFMRESADQQCRAAACSWREGLAPRRIAVVGDVQRTGLLERSLLGRRQNDAERVAVLNAIAADKPDMLLMLGDQVVSGNAAEWGYFDNIMDPIRSAGIPVRAMLGNHDYEGGAAPVTLENFTERFPHQRGECHGLTMLGDVALFTVDSNLDQLSARDAERQARRFSLALAQLDADPCVRSVIVASHHPPFTNSGLSGGRDIVLVEQMFAKPFLEAKKTRLYLSGHVHSYERFEMDGKMFVVTGGGGGPRRTVDISDRRPHTNDVYHTGRLRPFHYVMLTLTDDRIGADVVMLQESNLQREQARFRIGDQFAIHV